LEPFVEALSTYLNRLAFRVLAFAVVVSFTLVATIDLLYRVTWIHASWGLFEVSNNPAWILLVMLSTMAPLVLSTWLTALLIAQARGHLRDWRAWTFPGYRRPHVWTATLVLAFTSVAVSVAFYVTAMAFHNAGSFAGVLAVVTTVVTFMAWAGIRWSPAAGPIIILALVVLALEPHVQGAARTAMRIVGGESAAGAVLVSPAAQLLFLLLAVGEILLLPRALRAPRELDERGPSRDSAGSATQSLHDTIASLPIPHRRVKGLAARVWHRRGAALPRHAAIWVACMLFAILVIGPLSSLPHRDPTLVLRALLLAALTPGIVAAVVWRERWPVLGLESLFPGRRRDFLWEIACTMALNLAEVWLAAAVAATGAVAAFRPPGVTMAGFALNLLVAGIGQALVLGALFLLTPFRAAFVYFVVMTLLAVAIAIPLELAWSGRPQLGTDGLLTIAAVEAAGGLVLALAGAALWTRRDLA
jgi:hypothetical protein